MTEQESRRSVVPNGTLIDSLRKRKGWTIEELALEAGIGMRTAQKAIAGHPVSIETLTVLSDKLGQSYESLLAEKPAQAGAAPAMINLQIQIDLSGGANPAAAAKLLEVITFLKGFLPDNTGICIVGALTGSAVIGVQRSAANEAALSNPALKLGLDALGVSGLREARPIPTTIRVLGEAEPHDYMAEGKGKYSWHRSVTAANDLTVPPPDEWDELTDRERLEFCIESKEAFLAEVETSNPHNWPLIRGGKRLDPKASPAELFAFAKAEMGAIGDSNPDRHSQLWHLAHVSKNRDMLSQMRDILGGLEE